MLSAVAMRVLSPAPNRAARVGGGKATSHYVVFETGYRLAVTVALLLSPPVMPRYNGDQEASIGLYNARPQGINGPVSNSMGNALSNLCPATHRLPPSRRYGRRVGTAEVQRINSAAGLAPGRRLNCVTVGNGCPSYNPPSSRRSQLSFGKENDELIHLIQPHLCQRLGEPHKSVDRRSHHLSLIGKPCR